MTVRRLASAFGAIMLLASCGGDGGTTQGSSSTPPPTPTPTPTYTPPPTPTPTTSPSYGLGFDLTKGFIGSSSMAESSYRELLPQAPGGLPTYDTTAPATATISAAGFAQINLQASPLVANLFSGPETNSFEEKDVVYRKDNVISFSQGGADANVSFGYSPAFLSEAYASKYVGFTRFGRVVTDNTYPQKKIWTNRLYLFGSSSVPSDLPTSGEVQYLVEIRTSTVSYDSDIGGLIGTGTLRLSFANNQLSGNFVARGSAQAGKEHLTGTLAFTGTLDPITNRITGNVTSADSSYQGTLSGQLFGPAASEIGVLVAMRSAAGGVVGTVIGINRGPVAPSL